MNRADTPRTAVVLMVVGLVSLAAAALTYLTDQPDGVWNLALGIGLGLNTATVAMLGAIRDAGSAEG